MRFSEGGIGGNRQGRDRTVFAGLFLIGANLCDKMFIKMCIYYEKYLYQKACIDEYAQA